MTPDRSHSDTVGRVANKVSPLQPLLLRSVIQGPPKNKKHDHPHSHLFEVEGIRIIVISFRNIAKNFLEILIDIFQGFYQNLPVFKLKNKKLSLLAFSLILFHLWLLAFSFHTKSYVSAFSFSIILFDFELTLDFQFP